MKNKTHTVENRLVVAEGEMGEGKGWTGSLGWADANYYLQNGSTKKDLLYSTGNSTQYSVMTYMGKESNKEWIYVYV